MQRRALDVLEVAFQRKAFADLLQAGERGLFRNSPVCTGAHLSTNRTTNNGDASAGKLDLVAARLG